MTGTSFSASRTSAYGNGRNRIGLSRPTFLPRARIASTATFAVPAAEFRTTMTASASSVLYVSKNGYWVPVIADSSLPTSVYTSKTLHHRFFLSSLHLKQIVGQDHGAYRSRTCCKSSSPLSRDRTPTNGSTDGIVEDLDRLDGMAGDEPVLVDHGRQLYPGVFGDTDREQQVFVDFLGILTEDLYPADSRNTHDVRMVTVDIQRS